MSEGWRRFILMSILSLAVVMFFSGINWGLPSRQIDRFLFGGHQHWSGEQIMRLAGTWDDSADRGADIAQHPLTGRDHPIVVNDTDAKRAEIVRRFRLYSAQPDEMITFRSLSAMKPSRLDFDPRFYQYGGLWVYPIGALLKVGGMLNLLTVKSDLSFYLDHPEAFARFYTVARAYSAIWGLIGVFIVYWIAMEWTGKAAVALIAAMLYAVMPVVVNMAHEAKPHLAGAVLTLIAVLMAMRFVRTGKTKHWIFTGIACGAAFGMVLTGVVSFIVIPVMTLLRPMTWIARLKITVASGLIGLAVFVVTNPYLPINLLFHHAVVKSNVGNYGNFYRPQLSIAGVENAIKLMCEGMSTVLMIVAMVCVAAQLCRWRQFGPGWLLAAPALLIAAQYVLLAHDQPGEYGRFAITLDIILAITAAAGLAWLRHGRIFLTSIVCTCALLAGLRYVSNFVCSTTRLSSRWMTAESLMDMRRSSRVLAVWSEPAPYCLPPVDLFSWKIVLLPRGSTVEQYHLGESVVSVQPVDRAKPDAETPSWMAATISWSNKPFEIVHHSTDTGTSW